MTQPVDENNAKALNKKPSARGSQEIPRIIGGISGFAIGSYAYLSYSMNHKKPLPIGRSLALYSVSSVGMAILGAFLLDKASQRISSRGFKASDEEHLKHARYPF